jgi:hypothetical protein
MVSVKREEYEKAGKRGTEEQVVTRKGGGRTKQRQHPLLISAATYPTRRMVQYRRPAAMTAHANLHARNRVNTGLKYKPQKSVRKEGAGAGHTDQRSGRRWSRCSSWWRAQRETIQAA